MTLTLDPARVEPLLGGRFGRPYLWREECESTQLLLRDPELPEGAVAVAERQTAGRGRLGRRWEAPAAVAVLCSVLLRPPAGRRLGELSLVAGVAAAEAVEATAPVRAGVKWPNDVIVSDRKVAGVLAEGVDGAVILGVGLNANQAERDLPPDARTPATSLAMLTGRPVDRAGLLVALLAALERRYDEWLADGLGGCAVELARRDVLRGHDVTVAGLRGTADGIAADGRLVVRTAAGEALVESGEVTLAGVTRA